MQRENHRFYMLFETKTPGFVRGFLFSIKFKTNKKYKNICIYKIFYIFDTSNNI